MLTKPEDAWTNYHQDALTAYLRELGYPVCMAADGITAGVPDTAEFLLSTYDDNRPGVVLLLEIARTLPGVRRDRVCFRFYPRKKGWRRLLPEPGHPMERRVYLHIGDISHGNVLQLYPAGELRRDTHRISQLYSICGYFGKKAILFAPKGEGPLLSPHRGYPCGLCIRSQPEKPRFPLRPSAKPEPDITNIHILRAALGSFLCCTQPDKKGTKT